MGLIMSDCKHEPFTLEEITPEVLDRLLLKNGVPDPFKDGKPCRPCKLCERFYYESDHG